MNFEKIGNIAKFINGAPFKPSDWVDEGLRIIRIQNLTDPNKPYNRTLKKVDKKYLVKKGDVLVSWSATIDIFLWNDDDALLNQHIFKVNFDKSKVEKSYFIFALKDTINDLSRMAHGSTMKHVVKGDFENHKIPLPTLSTQLHIANILTKAESLIAQRKESIRLLDEYLKSVFLEMFGDPIRNEKGWETALLGEICGVGSSKRVFVEELVKSGIPFYRGTEIGQMAEGNEILPSLFITEEHYDQLKKHTDIPKIGDLLMPSICPDGRIYRVVNDQPFYFKDGRVLWVKVDKSDINSIYLQTVLKVIFRTNYNNIASGTTFAELKIVALKQINLPVAPLELQTKFAQIVEKTEALKAQYQQSLQELENLYGSLSQKAFKGELNLKDEGLLMAAEPETKYGV